MEIERAFGILKIPPGASVTELNTSYRKLAKVYHPDFNQGNESWAHSRMTELNLAYESALEFLTSSGKPALLKARVAQGVKTPGEKGIRNRFNAAVTLMLDAIYKYYQYSLENVMLRREGVRRFRYGECIKDLKQGIDFLELLQRQMQVPSERENLIILSDFAKAFMQNALAERHLSPTSNGYEANAYRHYRDGSECLDYAIKDVFFGDLLIPVREGSFYQKIRASYEEFLIVVSKYSESCWLSATIMKIYLLEVLTRVIGVLKNLRH